MNEQKEWYPCINFAICGNKIPFSTRDEEYYRSRGWVDDQGNVVKPKRCFKCRQQKRQESGQNGYNQ